MPIGQLGPTLALVGVLIASFIVLRIDTRRRRLAERVDDLPELGVDADPAGGQRQSIRRSQPGGARARNLIIKLLGVLIDLKLAQVVPNWAVFAIGIIAGVVDVGVGRLYFSLPVSLLGGAVTGLVVTRAIFRWEFSRYAAQLRKQLPDAIELLVSTTNAGLPVSEGFRAIAREMPQPTGEEFKRIVGEIALGERIDAALRSLHHRTRVPEYAILAVTLSVQARSGGRLAETILTLAETVRQRMYLVARANALAGEAKLSAIVLAVMPVVAGAALSIADPNYLRPLFHDPRGNFLLMIGVVTLALGALTMRQLIRGATRG